MTARLVQAVAAGVEGATTVDITLAGTGADNCVFLGTLSFSTGTAAAPTTVTLGGSAFTLQGTHYAPEDAAILALYAFPKVSAGQTAISVVQAGTTNTTLTACALEFTGIRSSTVIMDQQSAGTATETSAWSSGATTKTTYPTEVAIGLFGGWSSAAFTPVGPAAPWVNGAFTTESLSSMKSVLGYGYQVLNSEQTVTYSGTGGNTNYWNTAKCWTFFSQPNPPVSEPDGLDDLQANAFDINQAMLTASTW